MESDLKATAILFILCLRVNNTLRLQKVSVKILSFGVTQEIQSGLQPATRTKLAARSDSETGKSLHDIPNGCYDVGDGYYDPEEQRVYNYLEEKNGAEFCIMI